MLKRVLIPAEKSKNPFFEGIMAHCKWQFDYGDILTPIDRFSVVLIHWPEQLFNWKEPTERQLNDLKKQFELWKANVKIVYVVHNEKRHYGMTEQYEKLYDLILTSSDAMVHMGDYSLEKYKSLYPNIQHIKIFHSLYGEPFKVYEKLKARQQLGIKPWQKVVAVPGTIRNLEERSLVLNVFGKLNVNHKMLLVPRMFYKKSNLDFPGRYALKPIIDVKGVLEKIYNLSYKGIREFNFGFQDYDDLSLIMSAADVIMIPRYNSLNSGNLFLGMSYNKVVVGPAIGNIEEVLKEFELPLFDPNKNKTVVKALQKGFVLSERGFNYNEIKIKNYKPEELAKLWDEFLTTLVKGF